MKIWRPVSHLHLWCILVPTAPAWHNQLCGIKSVILITNYSKMHTVNYRICFLFNLFIHLFAYSSLLKFFRTIITLKSLLFTSFQIWRRRHWSIFKVTFKFVCMCSFAFSSSFWYLIYIVISIYEWNSSA